jgi:spore germination cell wall hydrolase CwlJ-like protein
MNACQFSFACDGLSDTPRSQPTYAAVKSIAATVIADYRPSNAVPISGPHVSQIEYTHYHRHDVSPEWSKKLQLLGRIGDHVFFRSKRVVRRYASTL